MLSTHVRSIQIALCLLSAALVGLIGCAEPAGPGAGRGGASGAADAARPDTPGARAPDADHTTRTPRATADASDTADARPGRAAGAPDADGADAGAVMAYVNGKPVYMAELHRVLVANHGLKIAQQIIALELVRQQADQAGLTVTEADVRAEHTDALDRMFPQVRGQSQKERLLEQLFAKGDVSRVQWDMSMRRNALLAKLAERDVEVSEQELRDAFADEYGRRVVVRHIQVPSLSDAQRVLMRLRKGEDFAELAKEVSVNPSRAEGGLLPAFSAKTSGVPLALREAGLSLTNVGEVSSPVQVMTAFHVLKLEEIIEPEGVEFADVRDELTGIVRRRKVQARKNALLLSLFRQARTQGAIQFVDPTLRRQAQQARQDHTEETQP
jgi:parvulin-like peptidyl-prolyl isomerase